MSRSGEVDKNISLLDHIVRSKTYPLSSAVKSFLKYRYGYEPISNISYAWKIFNRKFTFIFDNSRYIKEMLINHLENEIYHRSKRWSRSKLYYTVLSKWFRVTDDLMVEVDMRKYSIWKFLSSCNLNQPSFQYAKKDNSINIRAVRWNSQSFKLLVIKYNWEKYFNTCQVKKNVDCYAMWIASFISNGYIQPILLYNEDNSLVGRIIAREMYDRLWVKYIFLDRLYLTNQRWRLSNCKRSFILEIAKSIKAQWFNVAVSVYSEHDNDNVDYLSENLSLKCMDWEVNTLRSWTYNLSFYKWKNRAYYSDSGVKTNYDSEADLWYDYIINPYIVNANN